VPTEVSPPEQVEALTQAEALAKELGRRGFATSVTADGMRHHYPCVRVTNAHLARMSEDVYAAPGKDGKWAFWWSWADRIGPIGDIEKAAVAIAYVLSPNPGPISA
jgi:hypothetical protein